MRRDETPDMAMHTNKSLHDATSSRDIATARTDPSVSRGILCFAALVFGGLGGWLLFEPQRLDEWVGLRASTAAATTELRAFYGGLELGLAAFFGFCALGAGRARLGCIALAFVSGGIAIARTVGFVLDGSADGMGFAFLGTEVLLLALGVIGARRGL